MDWRTVDSLIGQLERIPQDRYVELDIDPKETKPVFRALYAAHDDFGGENPELVSPAVKAGRALLERLDPF